ncbi:hypothetical protein, partial [Neisseria sicca]|uniref:hypothetical protein n=1 Tax=Neisseria sicca TaxID=490 RepID=UPI003F68AC08
SETQGFGGEKGIGKWKKVGGDMMRYDVREGEGEGGESGVIDLVKWVVGKKLKKKCGGWGGGG